MAHYEVPKPANLHRATLISARRRCSKLTQTNNHLSLVAGLQAHTEQHTVPPASGAPSSCRATHRSAWKWGYKLTMSNSVPPGCEAARSYKATHSRPDSKVLGYKLTQISFPPGSGVPNSLELSQLRLAAGLQAYTEQKTVPPCGRALSSHRVALSSAWQRNSKITQSKTDLSLATGLQAHSEQHSFKPGSGSLNSY
ncbi:hypothetical protein RRG08_034832 [Elysia crispata]|uniref:Uncharacterized protein n=1 Tax=Elysia crispata TaxID=231223 RepID=A0AAE1ALY3_9GAST|nr:hypothetical protein RRG08_034832 [Elysia crispata]